jgi:hypothetical protein
MIYRYTEDVPFSGTVRKEIFFTNRMVIFYVTQPQSSFRKSAYKSWLPFERTLSKTSSRRGFTTLHPVITFLSLSNILGAGLISNLVGASKYLRHC